jgi:hypothetical protein
MAECYWPIVGSAALASVRTMTEGSFGEANNVGLAPGRFGLEQRTSGEPAFDAS